MPVQAFKKLAIKANQVNACREKKKKKQQQIKEKVYYFTVTLPVLSGCTEVAVCHSH